MIETAPYAAILLLISRQIDELVPVYVVLRLANCSEDVLKSQLSRLDISVEAYAVSGAEDGSELGATQRAKDLIYSGSVTDKEDPLVIVDEVDEDDSISNYVFIIWKTEAFLSAFYTER